MGPVPRRAVAGAKATPAADPDRLPAGGGSPRSAVTSGGSRRVEGRLERTEIEGCASTGGRRPAPGTHANRRSSP